jgi:hypothetical protein
VAIGWVRVWVGLGQFDSVRLLSHGSSRVGSGIGLFSVGSYQVESGWLSGHLASSYFGFRVVSGRVGSVIRSSSVGLF